MPLEQLGDIVELKLNTEDAEAMIVEVSDNEIKDAMFDNDSSKASSPDGYTSCFFKKAWSLIEKDVFDTPNQISDFRPIACCNVLYKWISKILTNRMKNGLSKVVSVNQSAFIPGRHIQDNILLTQELLRGYNRKQGAKRCAMKIDIQKAYDTVSWKFLEDVLKEVGFHQVMINWIMICVSTASFSICINDEVCGYFKGGRGLRQGDPMSPYLFTLVMEVLNMIMIKNIKDDSRFKYHYGCKELKLTHLCFADDLLMLCNGDVDSLKVMKKSLEEFSKVSGLFPNHSKSTIFFGSMLENKKQELLEIMPFKCGKLPMKYLGVPLLSKRLGVNDCKCLIESVERRIKCWRNRVLSYAGRIQLIASVLASMQNYWAYVYLLPNTVVMELEKLLRRFLWNSGDSAKGKAKVAWSIVCKPKDQGGLGIKSLHKWNEVLLVSQLWKLIERKESLWVKWVNTIKLKNLSIWEVDHSLGMINGAKWVPWTVSNRDLYDARLALDAKVADIIINNKWNWPEGWVEDFPELNQIPNPVIDANATDKVCWVNSDNKEVDFSTKVAWLSLRDNDAKVQWSHVVWFSQYNPRQAFILWLAIQRKLMTQDRIMRWQQGAILKCPLCNVCEDSHEHLFFNCSYSAKIWDWIKVKGRMENADSTLYRVVDKISEKPSNNNIWRIIQRLIVSATVYFIWQERNKRIFQSEKRTPEVLCRNVEESIVSMLRALNVKKSNAVLIVAKVWGLNWCNNRLMQIE
ncbi:RNA-directed DNA polymerase, eukaryota, reverse transcriptase zinc-binding domain protein [Tanacetum coccineum]